MVLTYIGWLITVRKVKSTTISQYLSGLRTAHLKRGLMPQNLRPDIVKSILKGQEHSEAKENKPPRLAITLPVMKLLKRLLKGSALNLHTKRMLWAVSCIAFHGSFRIHELLSREESNYDPTTTLLGMNIRVITVRVGDRDENILVVNLKNPKEDKYGMGVNVELFETKTFSCPVTSWIKLLNVSTVKPCPTKPVFRQSNGKCLTGAKFNKVLKSLLGQYLDYGKGQYLSHSFRSGVASMMAEAGYSDEVIMRQGRWHSQAFLRYCKTGRGSRLREQRALAQSLANLTAK